MTYRISLPLFLVVAAACAGQRDRIDSSTFASIHDAEAARRLLYVDACYRSEKNGPTLSINRAQIVRGPRPISLERESLEGRVEILDVQGQVLWTGRYDPKIVPNGPLPRACSRLRLRLPAPEGAFSVRLLEKARQLSATARIQDEPTAEHSSTLVPQ